MTQANAINISTAGIVGNSGSAFAVSSLTQYGALTASSTYQIASATGSQNNLLQANTGAVPSFTATPTVTSIDINSVNSLDPNAGVNVGYLSGIIGGLAFKQAVIVATTGSNLTATYANGAAGVGATLTNAGANAAFALDGVTTSTGNRVLIKDQSTTFQNGIYSVTTEGDGSTPWVLTRTTDFNSAATIEAGSLVPVEFGTVNATTSWLQTQTVTTVGTDPILFVQFTYGPSTFLIKANNLSDVPSPSTARSNLGITNIATQSTTNHFVLVGAASNGVTSVTPSTAGFVLTSNGVGSDPSFQSVTAVGVITELDGDTGSALPTAGKVAVSGGSTGLTFNGSGSTVSLGGTLNVGHGGLGITTTPTNGQIPIGNGTNYTAAVITAGTGISVTNGAGSITIAATGSAGFSSIVIQTFTSSGTYTPTASMKYCIVEMVGGGGGGGRANTTSGGNPNSVGGGGGAGEYGRGVFSSATIGASQTVTIGAAGTGSTSDNTNGGTGGTTSVGALITTIGGTGGNFGPNTSAPGFTRGGAGGTGGTGGSFHSPGNVGGASFGNTNSESGGYGAASSYGSGGIGGALFSASGARNGGAASGYGSGGGGGLDNSNLSGANGGAGSAGVIIITEYI